MRASLSTASFVALVAALVALPATAAEGKGQIYQQRAADGRIVLTDRPSATAVTERTWEIEREDKQAAQQRAFDVRREADAVSERIQRRMEAQERLLAAEQERAWQMRREQQLARADDERFYPGYVIATPYANRPFRHRGPYFDNGPPRKGPHSRPPVRKPALP